MHTRILGYSRSLPFPVSHPDFSFSLLPWRFSFPPFKPPAGLVVDVMRRTAPLRYFATVCVPCPISFPPSNSFCLPVPAQNRQSAAAHAYTAKFLQETKHGDSGPHWSFFKINLSSQRRIPCRGKSNSGQKPPQFPLFFSLSQN